MNRAIDALREWRELRARLRDESEFHIDRAAADFRALGLSSSMAKQAARARFGSRQNLKLALRELGGDWEGLVRLFSAHRVQASPWFQPAVLAMAILLIPLLSPAPLAVIEAVAGRPLVAADRDAVFISKQAWNLTYVGINRADFESIRSLDSVIKLERYQSIHARAYARKGVSLTSIESRIRNKTGNQRLRVVPLFEREPIVMGPAKAVWGVMAFVSLFLVAVPRRSYRWLGYGFVVGCLHSLASLLAWAFAIQLWSRISWPTDSAALFGFLFISAVCLGVAVLQCQVWWRDLRRRCPLCLDCLLLPLTEGSENCLLLDPATTESICAHGHGVLVETRWSSRFRPQRSPLHGLVHG